MDEIFRLSLGNHADITGATYDGDFSMTLKQAQKTKHDHIFSGIKFKQGNRVLDIGCGWGPILNQIKKRGGKDIGFTLSPAQARSNRSRGLNCYVGDYKKLGPKKVGKCDCIISVGAFEHFCSIKEMKDGKQDQIYNEFFKLCHDLLPKGGRMFLQTMMWGKEVPEFPKDLNVNAKRMSDSWVLGHVSKFYPGSWLPNNIEHIEKCAKPYFKLVSENNGRLDYIQTLHE